MAKAMVFALFFNSLLSKSSNRHANLPQLTGRSSDRSPIQFILFYDTYVLRNTGQLRSIAAFLLEMTKSEDVFTMVDKMVDFVSISLDFRMSGWQSVLTKRLTAQRCHRE